MYYEDFEDIDSASVESNGIVVSIRISEPDNRFVIDGPSGTASANSIEEALRHIPEQDRQNLKERVYNTVRSAFIRFEEERPDSSKGVIPFIEGNDYRIPHLDRTYHFDMDYLHNPSVEAFGGVNSSLELGYHLKTGEPAAWPCWMHLKRKGPKSSSESDFLLDPYLLIDLFFNNSEGEQSRVTFHDTAGAATNFVFDSSPRYNLVRIDGPEEVIKSSYFALQRNIIRVLDALFQDLSTERDRVSEPIMISYLMKYWDRAGTKSKARLAQEKKVIGSLGPDIALYDPSTLPFDYSFCIASDLTETLKSGDYGRFLRLTRQSQPRTYLEEMKSRLGGPAGMTNHELFQRFQYDNTLVYQNLV